jgi:signal transduction histidine kinase/ActR/RegA family two-component response regulator
VSEAVGNAFERRVLVLGPNAKDEQFTRVVLEEVGIPCVPCKSGDALIRELDRGAGAVIVAEEAILRDGYEPLKNALDRQLPWSDLPLIVVTSSGAASPAGAEEAVADLGNVSLLERPVRVSALVSAVRTALRARSRQYQLRAHMHERERAAEALKEADRRKNEFLAVLAHELRNPLAPIRNALNVMRLAGPDAAAAAGMADMLERQVEHMVRLVDDLFEVSRITQGRIDLSIEPTELAAVIRQAVETSHPQIDALGQVLEFDVDAEPLWVAADPIRLTQVFANILNNASKFSEDGGVIRLTARRRGDTAEVSVRDFGAGISQETLSRVFDMFAQGTRNAPRNMGGLGIGLTLAKSLVESHGGWIEARSEGPGCGSEFLVVLPLMMTAAARAEAAPSRARAVASGNPQRILVVDDNHDSADSSAILLKMLGADVHLTYDGPSALEAIDSYRPDVVLLDIGLPGMNGHEVARRIRKRPELDHLTLIAITGWGQAEDRARSRAAGFQHHLVKPVDPTELQALLAALEAERHTTKW